MLLCELPNPSSQSKRTGSGNRTRNIHYLISVTCSRTSTPKIQVPRELVADCLGSTVGVANYSLCISHSEMRTNLNGGHSLIPRCLDKRYCSMHFVSKMTQSNFEPWLGDDDMVWSKVTTVLFCFVSPLQLPMQLLMPFNSITCPKCTSMVSFLVHTTQPR